MMFFLFNLFWAHFFGIRPDSYVFWPHYLALGCILLAFDQKICTLWPDFDIQKWNIVGFSPKY